MKVISHYPVYIDNKRVGDAGNNWLYTEGTEPTDSEKKAQSKLGKIWDKTKGAWRSMTTGEQSDVQNFLTSGKVGALATLLGLSAPATATPAVTTAPAAPAADDKKGKMSKTTKILLISGGAVVLGLIIWAVAKKK